MLRPPFHPNDPKKIARIITYILIKIKLKTQTSSQKNRSNLRFESVLTVSAILDDFKNR